MSVVGAFLIIYKFYGIPDFLKFDWTTTNTRTDLLISQKKQRNNKKSTPFLNFEHTELKNVPKIQCYEDLELQKGNLI